MMVLKAEDLPSGNQELAALRALAPAHKVQVRTGQQLEIRQRYRWVNAITHLDSARQSHTRSVLECQQPQLAPEGARQTTKCQWVTNFHLPAKNLQALAANGARRRWKIENAGLQVQQYGGVAPEQGYTQEAPAGKNCYLLLQMAHTLFQLMARGPRLKQIVSDGGGSAKKLAFCLLEAWRNSPIGRGVTEFLGAQGFHIRFDST